MLMTSSSKDRAKKRIRGRVLASKRASIKVVRSNRYLTGLVTNEQGRVLTAVSTKNLDCVGSAKNAKAAASLGEVLAEKCKALNLKEMAFDRSGYKYHGVIKTLADTLRNHHIII